MHPLLRTPSYPVTVYSPTAFCIPGDLPPGLEFVSYPELIQGRLVLKSRLEMDKSTLIEPVNLKPNTQYFICNEVLQTMEDLRLKNVMAKIQLDARDDQLNTLYNTFVMGARIFTEQFVNLTELSFQVVRQSGQPADSFEHSFTLEITEHLDTIASAGYDTRRGVITDTLFKYQ